MTRQKKGPVVFAVCGSFCTLRRGLEAAQELVEQLSDADITAAVKDLTMQKKPKTKPVHYDEVDMAQMSLFDTVQDDDIIKELSELDISNMTPMDALNTLYRFQGKVKNRWK